MDDLLVRSANRENFYEPDQLIEQFLKELVKNRRFQSPVDILMEESNYVALSEAYSSKKRLPLPTHYTLAIRIFTGPWGSEDGAGNRYRIDIKEIPIAYAFP